MNSTTHQEFKGASWKDRFIHAWVRGWKVVVLLIWLQLLGYIIWLPCQLLPGEWRERAEVVFALIFGPPLLYWGYKCMYPDPEPRTDPSSQPIQCFTYRTTIPAHADTCPNCGWSYKRR